MTEADWGSGTGEAASTSSTSLPPPSDGATGPLPEAVLAALGRLEAAITVVLDLDVDDLSQTQLEETLRRLQPQLDRVHGYRSRLAGVLAEHARSRQGNQANGNAGERARRDAARFLRSELQLTDSEAKRTVTAGQQARTSPSVGQATRDGRLNPEQSATIARLLEDVDAAVRDHLEAELVEAAGRMDAVALGRFGRRRLLELDPAQGERRERRDHRRRAFRLSQTSDGAVIPSGRLYGAQAEIAMAAWHAFRRPDARGEVRTPDQRGADAFEQLCAAALRAGEASTRHGERPQLLIVTDQETLRDGSGVVELGFTGPASLAAVRCLLSDCSVSRVGLSDQEVDVSVSKKVRTVPAGLWRVLVARDGGCTWSGCDAPAAWCDVAHGESPYAADGHLSPANAALLCRRHHRAYDHGPYVMLFDGDGVRYERDPDAEVAPHDPQAAANPSDGEPGDRPLAMSASGPGRVVTVKVGPRGGRDGASIFRSPPRPSAIGSSSRSSAPGSSRSSAPGSSRSSASGSSRSSAPGSEALETACCALAAVASTPRVRSQRSRDGPPRRVRSGRAPPFVPVLLMDPPRGSSAWVHREAALAHRR
ncbi:MAG: DUF222 domain-containing protein [Nitriliruptoraceae bacterium]